MYDKNSNFIKDKRTSVIINTNSDQYEAIKHERKKYKEFLSLQKEVSQLRNEVMELRKIIFGKIDGTTINTD